jgi:hypothetical protein
MALVNGLHQPADDPELAGIARDRGARIIDIRRPRPTAELSFWSGEVLGLATPRIAVLGTDCAIGKRTTCSLLVDACRRGGLRAEMVYTGQTGGSRHPPRFILDATLPDFMCGESSGDPRLPARLTGDHPSRGGGARNPSGPCGAEFILAEGRGESSSTRRRGVSLSRGAAASLRL